MHSSYPHQVAGHGHIFQSEPGKIMKSASPNEYWFYQKDAHKLEKFVPRYFGHTATQDSDMSFVNPAKPVPHHFIVLEDLVYSFAQPCILDIKMGTTLYGPNTDADKQARAIAKAESSTTSALGYRICGMKIPKDNCTYNKSYGRSLTPETVSEAFLKFFTDSATGCLRDAVIHSVLHDLKCLRDEISKILGYRFTCSSLFLAYDTAAEHPRPVVRIIDFAKISHLDDNSPDQGFLIGLDNILACLANLSPDCVPESPAKHFLTTQESDA